MSPVAPFVLVIMVMAILYGTYRIAKQDGWMAQIVAKIRERMGR